MSRPRTICISLFLAVLPLGFAFAAAQEDRIARQPAQKQKAAPNPQPSTMTMQQLLADWEGQSRKLQTLDLDIYRIDKDPQWGDEEHYVGRAAFKTPQLAFLDFRKVTLQPQPDPKDKKKKKLVPVKKNNVVVSVPFETIVCTDQEVWQYRYDLKKIYIFPLDKDQRKRALEEGPLPFLFNMRAAEALKRYRLELRGEDQKQYLVRIEPLLPQDQDTFSTAWIYLDKEFLLPMRIFLLAPNGKMTKDFWLSHIKPNQPVDPRFFVGVNPGNTFKIERNPGGPAPANSPRARRRQANEKAAQRQQGDDTNQPR